MEVKLDSGVQTVLNALELSKYIPVFEKYGVTMKVFTTLNENDLKTMGVEEDDLESLLKYVRKLGKADSKKINLDLQLDDIRKGIHVIDEHLKRIDVSLCYTLDHFRPDEWMDQMTTEKTLSEIALKTGDHIQEICTEFNDMIDQLLPEEVAEPDENAVPRTTILTLSVAAMAVAIYFVTIFFKM